MKKPGSRSDDALWNQCRNAAIAIFVNVEYEIAQRPRTDKSLRPPVNFVIARKAGPWPNGRAPVFYYAMGAIAKTKQEDTEC